ncbi:hypothetical protein [Congregibacter sp.]|uniref:hypothetical protein n=1 Tax=Congregibacter sp. TaxID=2744308 RepID=UPI00385A719A
MKKLSHGGILILTLLLGACALPNQSAYKQWRSFYSQVDAMSTEERNTEFVNVQAQYEESPNAMTRLQLAYLTLLAPAAEGGDYHSEEMSSLLKGIDADHELAPVRDLLTRSLRLRENHAGTTAELRKLSKQCEVVEDSRAELEREREKLQREAVICSDQVEALKEIENVMSAPEPSPPQLR